jgi:hypothetical protein
LRKLNQISYLDFNIEIMKSKTPTRFMTNILVVSLLILLIGQIFQIQHYPYGKLISLIGLGAYLILSMLEIDRLKKVIARLESEETKSE